MKYVKKNRNVILIISNYLFLQSLKDTPSRFCIFVYFNMTIYCIQYFFFKLDRFLFSDVLSRYDVFSYGKFHVSNFIFTFTKYI